LLFPKIARTFAADVPEQENEKTLQTFLHRDRLLSAFSITINAKAFPETVKAFTFVT
jgi:hypothetical protein